MTVPSTKNMASSFEITLILGTCIPGIAPEGPCGREDTTASRLGVKGLSVYQRICSILYSVLKWYYSKPYP
jgi:hypothetical protein